MKYILLILLAFLQVVLVLVLSYKKHSSASRMFMVIVSAIAFWTVVNAALDYSQFQAHASVGTLSIINKLGFFTGCASVLLSYRLSLVFPVERPRSKFSRYVTILGAAFVFLTLLPAVSGSFYLKPGGQVAQYTNGSLVALVGIYALIIILLGAKNFLRGYKVTDPQTKRQAATIFSGLLLCIVFGIVFITVIPTLTGSETLLFIGYYAPFLFTGSIIYSILRQRLFDFRPIVARSVGYILSITAVAITYSIVAFSFINRVLFGDNSKVSPSQQVAYTILAVATAFAFQPLQRVFNKITNRLFYRDAYDTQQVLDKVSGIIVGNVDARRIQKGALTTVSEALRPTYAVFLLFDSGEKLQKGYLVGQQWEMHEPSELTTTLKRSGKRVVLYDKLEQTVSSKLRDRLQLEDISLVSPLVTKDEIIGYLILGPKKSGNIYNSQDVGLLTIASNELAVALQNAQRFEEIQAFNITLQQKVTDATRELKETNKKLIALDEAKDEFISMASHQLRTPLTSINGYLSMLHEGDLGKLTPKQEDMVKTAYGSSQRMSFLIADFLNVSRIKTGKFVIDAKKIDLPSMVADEISQLGEMAEARGVKLIYEKPEVFPAVKLDDNKMRQVMMNMIDNAIYYTPAGGTITVQLYSTGDEVIFKVVDTGIGVPKAEQHKLFTKFYRAGNAKKARPDGTGVGLFMAQKVIVEQQGAVIFESVEGQGSTFGFRFPLAKIKA